jgi:hypothetical protein
LATTDQSSDSKDALNWYNSIKTGKKAFGNITFAGVTQHVAKYALLPSDLDMKKVYNDLMLDHWQIPAPNLILSVTGSAHLLKGKNSNPLPS